MERRRRVHASTGGACGDESTEGTDPFQNRRLSQVVAQIFESNTCINQLQTCESCEELEDSENSEEIETDFIDYKEEPKNKELFRETFKEIEAFFKRESPVKVKITDADSDSTSTISDFLDKKEYESETEKEPKETKETKEGEDQTDANAIKRETLINDIDIQSISTQIRQRSESMVTRRYPIRSFAKDCEFSSMGATSMQPTTRNSNVQYSNLCANKPMFTNSSIETTFGVTPPEQRSSLRSIRRSRSPDCKRVSPTFRWSVTSV